MIMKIVYKKRNLMNNTTVQIVVKEMAKIYIMQIINIIMLVAALVMTTMLIKKIIEN